MQTPQSPATRPWYRQFWPWFLIALPGSVVIASAVTINIAFNHQDSVVRDNYYREGLAINRELAASEYAQAMQLSAALRWEPATGSLEVILSRPVDAVELQLTLVHPRHAEQDIQTVLRLSGREIYRVTGIDAALQGKRQLVLNPAMGDAWQLRGQIDFGRQDTVELQPY